MIVGNQNVSCISIFPSEDDSVLIIDPDTVITSPPSFQSFKPAAGRDTEVARLMSCVQKVKPAKGGRPHAPGNAPRGFGVNAMEEVLCRPVAEAQDHRSIYHFTVIRANGKSH